MRSFSNVSRTPKSDKMLKIEINKKEFTTVFKISFSSAV